MASKQNKKAMLDLLELFQNHSQKRSNSKSKMIDPQSVAVKEKNFKIVEGVLYFIGRDKIVKVPESIRGEKIKTIGEGLCRQ